MGRAATFSRRTFLLGSSATAMGIAFGIFEGRRELENPLSTDLAEGEVTFNPWVLIDEDKVTLIVPHADKGQGVASAQAVLLAEEMDLKWGDFEISFGKPAAAYWNRLVAEVVIPFAATDESVLAERVRDIVNVFPKILRLQATGGSTT